MTERILNHMNKDHNLSLFDYLEFYGKVPLDPLDPNNKVELIDIDLVHILLQYTSRVDTKATKRIELTPPLKTLGGARERLVEMAHTAATALRVSPYQISDFKFPQGLRGWLAASTVLLLGLNVFTHEFGLAERFYPQLDSSLNHLRLGAVLFLLAIHFSEAIFIMRPLLKKYRSPYNIRPKWYLACVIEGFPAWVRFKTLDPKH